MGISGALGFVALAGWVAVIAGIGLAITAASQNRSSRTGVTLAIVGLVVGILFGVISQGIIIVQPQEVAVVFDTVSGNLLEPRGPGISIVVPVIQQATIYSVAQREYTMSGSTTAGAVQGDDAVVGRTADGQEVRIDATLIYNIETTTANLIHQRWQQRFESGLVRPTARGIIRDEVARYNVEEVYSTQRDALRIGIEELIRTRFAEEGLSVTDFLIRDVRFTDEYAQSIEQKQIAEQNRLRAQQEADRLRVEAQGQRDAAVYQAEGQRLSAVERANGEADALRLRAQAEADAILLRAQADAQALALINEQITQNPDLIEWRYIENLADNIQLMLLPSNSPFVFDFQSLAGGDTASTPVVPSAPAAAEKPAPSTDAVTEGE